MLYNRLYNCTEWDAQRINRELQAADSTLLGEVYAFLRAARRMRGAGAGLLPLLPYWTRSTPSFAQPGGVRGAGAGLLLLLRCWTRSTPSFALPGGVSGAGAAVLLLYWTRKIALLRRRLGCYVAYCVWPSQKKQIGMERLGSGPTPTVTAFRRAGGSGAGGAPSAEAERLCCGTASRYIRALALVGIYMLCQKVRRLDVSFLPRRLWPAGRGWRGKRGRRRPPWQLLRRRLGLEGHAAAAGSRWSCWRSQECFAPSLSRVSCCRLCQCVWPLQRKGEKSLSLFSSFSLFLFLSFGPSLSLPVCLRLRLRLCQESNPRLRLNVRPPWPISETLCEWARPRRRFLVPAPCPESRQNLGRIWAESGRNLGRISAEWGGQGFSCKPPPLSTPPRLILVGWDQPSPTWGLTTQNLRKSRFLERFSSEACVL